MALDLPSRLYSSETLLAGVSLVKEEVGMDSLDAMGVQELQDQLAALEAACMDSTLKRFVTNTISEYMLTWALYIYQPPLLFRRR